MRAILCAFFLFACSTSRLPGGLEFDGGPGFDAGPEADAGLGLDAGTDASVPTGPVCEVEGFDVKQYFEDSCGTSTCHGSEHEPTADNAVDLVTPPLFDRLTSQFASNPSCADLPIIDARDWENSFLIRKLRADHRMCGDRMPFDGMASEDDIECIGAWIVGGGER